MDQEMKFYQRRAAEEYAAALNAADAVARERHTELADLYSGKFEAMLKSARKPKPVLKMVFDKDRAELAR